MFGLFVVCALLPRDSFMMFRLSSALCSFYCLAVSAVQGDVSAIELGRAVADMAQHVAQGDGHASDIADGLARALRGESAVASSGVAPPSFFGVDAIAGAEVITLRPPAEATQDIGRAVAALGDARVSRRAALTSAYGADWQRMLDGEKRAISKVLRAELVLATAAADGRSL